MHPSFKIQRFPKTFNNSLQAWNAADELLISHIEEFNIQCDTVMNDSFGYLSLSLNEPKIHVIADLYSQKEAVLFNAGVNDVDQDRFIFQSTFDEAEVEWGNGIMRVPKSIDLFEVYLRHFVLNCSAESTLFCGFMTRHFSSQMIKLASLYFGEVVQTKAKKKARLMVLSKPKPLIEKELIHLIDYKGEEYQQHFGVFSSNSIDYATQFLIDNMVVPTENMVVMDLACGNGVLGKELVKAMAPNTGKLIMVDDSRLAIESAKINVKTDADFYQVHNLSEMPESSVDLIISNPPFHVGHEIDLSLPIGLFKQAANCLRLGGELQMVANRHLNYRPMLNRYFDEVEIIAQNKKFVVYRCVK